MRGWGLYPITHRLGMSVADFRDLAQQAQAELDLLPLKPYVALYVLRQLFGYMH